MAQYRRARPNNCTWLRYDDSDNWVAHNPASGQSHLFTASARQLWTIVPEDLGCTASDVAALLAAHIGHPTADESLTRSVEETLALMETAGLIEFV